MPCADSYAKETLAAQQGSHDHPAAADLCGPFCLCNCCGTGSGAVFQWEAINSGEIRATDLAKPISPYISLFTPRYFGEIWQPPKVNA